MKDACVKKIINLWFAFVMLGSTVSFLRASKEVHSEEEKEGKDIAKDIIQLPEDLIEAVELLRDVREMRIKEMGH